VAGGSAYSLKIESKFLVKICPELPVPGGGRPPKHTRTQKEKIAQSGEHKYSDRKTPMSPLHLSCLSFGGEPVTSDGTRLACWKMQQFLSFQMLIPLKDFLVATVCSFSLFVILSDHMVINVES